MGPAGEGLAVFLSAGVLLVIGTSQLDPGWSPGEPTLPLRPTATDTPVVASNARTVRLDLVARRDGRTIGARLISPAAASETAIVLVAGAGASSRTQLLGQAEALAARGVHAVTYDKASAGYSWRRRDFAELAADLVAVVAKARARTDARRVGVLGFSEGGWVAARAAADPSVLDFLILASAPVVTPLEQAAWIIDRPLVRLPDPVRRVPASLLAAGRAYLPYLEEDSRPQLAASTVPVLGLWGADDSTVPVGTAVRRLTEHTHRPVTAVVLPGAGHALDVRSGWPHYVAAWLAGPEPAVDAVQGVEPALSHGVPGLPRGGWLTSPVLHLLIATIAGLAAAVVRRRHRPTSTKEPAHVRS